MDPFKIIHRQHPVRAQLWINFGDNDSVLVAKQHASLFLGRSLLPVIHLGFQSKPQIFHLILDVNPVVLHTTGRKKKEQILESW